MDVEVPDARASRLVVADLEFDCQPRQCQVSARRFFSDLIEIPLSAFFDVMDAIKRVLTIHDVADDDMVPTFEEFPFVFPLAIMHADGRSEGKIHGIRTNHKNLSVSMIKEMVYECYPDVDDERYEIVIGIIDRETYSHYRFPDVRSTRAVSTVYTMAKELCVAYIVPKTASHFAMVTVKNREDTCVVSPPLIIPVDRPPDSMTFSTLKERSHLFDTSLKPYRTNDINFDGHFLVVKPSVTDMMHPSLDIHRFLVYLDNGAMSSFGFLPFKGFEEASMDLDAQLKSIWRRACEETRAIRQKTSNINYIISHCLRRPYYGERGDDITYEFKINQDISKLRIVIRAKRFIVPFHPVSMIDPATTIRYNAARLIESLKTSTPVLDAASIIIRDLASIAPAQDPRGLLSALKPHQKASLGFMLDRERNAPSIIDSVWTPLQGGIGHYFPSLLARNPPANQPRIKGGLLADDMGLGKTCTTIALCLANPAIPSVNRMVTLKSKATLVLCPAALLYQWHAEVLKHAGESLKVLVFHGTGKRGITVDDMVENYDIVLMSYTTYVKYLNAGMLMRNGDSRAFTSIQWHRVVYDESHAMSQLAARARPKTDYAWLLSATPLKNFDRQLEALGIHNVQSCTVNTIYMFMSFGFRHRVEDTQISIPGLEETIVECPMSPAELELYKEALHFVVEAIGKQSDTMTVVNGLHALRSLCSGGRYNIEWIRSKLAKKEVEGYKVTKLDPPDDVCAVCMDAFQEPTMTQCGHWFCRECIEASLGFRSICPLCRGAQTKRTLKICAPAEDPASTASSSNTGSPLVEFSHKHNAFLQVVRQVKSQDPAAKIVCFTNISSGLKDFECMVKNAGYSLVMMTGATAISRRSSMLAQFQKPGSGIDICVLTTRAAANGLNLVAANVVVFLDVCMESSSMVQAIGRVMRQGQTKQVQVYHMVSSASVEMRMLDHISSQDIRPNKEKMISFLM